MMTSIDYSAWNEYPDMSCTRSIIRRMNGSQLLISFQAWISFIMKICHTRNTSTVTAVHQGLSKDLLDFTARSSKASMSGCIEPSMLYYN